MIVKCVRRVLKIYKKKNKNSFWNNLKFIILTKKGRESMVWNSGSCETEGAELSIPALLFVSYVEVGYIILRHSSMYSNQVFYAYLNVTYLTLSDHHLEAPWQRRRFLVSLLIMQQPSFYRNSMKTDQALTQSERQRKVWSLVWISCRPRSESVGRYYQKPFYNWKFK